MSDYWAGLTNCLVMGWEFTETETHNVRNLIRLNLGGFDIELHQHSDVISHHGKYQGTQVASTSVWIRDLKKEDFEAAQRIVQDISEILSFACASPVRKYGYEYPEATPPSYYHATFGVARFFRPVIWSRSGDIVKEFIEKIWPKYHELRDKRQLHVVIDYLACIQMPEIPQELELMMSFTTLENLKSTYAESKGIPFVKPAFRKISTPPKTDIKREPFYHFEELLTDMFDEVGMRPALKEIIDLRNIIIHTGISVLPFNEQTEILDRSQDLIREYLLRLLGFTGRYQSYSQPNAAPLSI